MRCSELSASAVSHVDPQILEGFADNRECIACVLRSWWQSDNEERWAADIVAAAKSSFGKPDGRYVAVTLDSSKLREVIAYRAFLSFLDEMQRRGWLEAEAAEHYRLEAKAVFDPDPVEEMPMRRMEQPDVFIAVMHQLIGENSSKIVPQNQPFVKADKPFGAWREISGERYLVMLEDTWAREYRKAAKKDGVDISFSERKNWEREMQKLLCEAGLIKTPTAGYRYRYDLLGDGKRDTTYVLALSVSKY